MLCFALFACVESPTLGTDAVDAAGVADTADDTAQDSGVDSGGETVHPSDVDVLIIGAGPAGLAAAIEAAASGASVQLLEREAQVGGAANLAGGLMMFSGTPEQVAEGITDSPEQLLSEWSHITGGITSDEWVQYFAAHNVDHVHDWLTGLGGTFGSMMPDPSAGTTTRVHQLNGDGAALVGLLEGAMPPTSVNFRAEANDLVVDEGGEVVGVEWTDLDDGSVHTTYAGAVIVATGGFMHNLERVRAIRPDLAELDVRISAFSGADGNGSALLEAHGAATQNLPALGLYAHAAPHPFNPEGEVMASFLPMVPWFNANTERFVDEFSANSFRTGTLRSQQAGGVAWMVVNGAVLENAEFSDLEDATVSVTIDDMLASGLARKADGLFDLAVAVDLNPALLEAALDAWNLGATGAAADPFRSADFPGFEMNDGPWYALPVAITSAKSFGGVDVDLAGRVVGLDGEVIPGVYAAGEVSGMAGGSLVGDYGFTGSLSAVLLSGRVAGAAAAVEAVEAAGE
ncbi:hypothetical protein LBMAG42_14840 [Deltaproteobacteria bacterium]|nr:hypothetical protein LBMAG42_14840 [Deltaproteobacteria bacterium]